MDLMQGVWLIAVLLGLCTSSFLFAGLLTARTYPERLVCMVGWCIAIVLTLYLTFKV